MTNTSHFASRSLHVVLVTLAVLLAAGCDNSDSVGKVGPGDHDGAVPGTGGGNGGATGGKPGTGGAVADAGPDGFSCPLTNLYCPDGYATDDHGCTVCASWATGGAGGGGTTGKGGTGGTPGDAAIDGHACPPLTDVYCTDYVIDAYGCMVCASTGVGGNPGKGGAAGGKGGTGAGGTGQGGAAGATGGTVTGPQPRVLLVDVASNRLASYDRTGQLVHDFADKLDFGSGFGERIVWIDQFSYVWDGYRYASLGAVLDPPRGLAEPLSPSRILIRAASSPAGTVKARVMTADGQTEKELSIPGAYEAMQLSPRRGYLFAVARGSTDSPTDGIVVRVADGSVIWKGAIAQSGFSHDDRRFLYVPKDRSTPVRILDLDKGTETTPALTQTAFASQPGVWVTLEAATDDLAVIQTDGVDKFGRLLWTMDWQAKVDRLGSDMPTYTDEYLTTFDPTGGKAAWQRQTNGLDGNPVVSKGSFEMDFATRTTAAFSASSWECFGRPDDLDFIIDNGAVKACVCGTGACTTLTTLPTLEVGYLPSLLVSANRSVVVVKYDWTRNALPTTYPDILCLSATGKLLATVPAAVPEVDATGQLVVVREQRSPGRVGVVDLSNGTLTWLGTSSSTTNMYRIVYE